MDLEINKKKREKVRTESKTSRLLILTIQIAMEALHHHYLSITLIQ